MEIQYCQTNLLQVIPLPDSNLLSKYKIQKPKFSWITNPPYLQAIKMLTKFTQTKIEQRVGALLSCDFTAGDSAPEQNQPN